MESLTISNYGAYLGKHSERVVVKCGEKERKEYALMDIAQIIIESKGVSISSDLIEACTERGIEITFLGFQGQPFAKVMSPLLSATVISRREQLAAYHDIRGFEITRRLICGKLKNQVNLIRYFAKYRKNRAPRRFSEMMERVEKMNALLEELQSLMLPEQAQLCPIDAMRSTILNLEGRAGSLYWECVQQLLPGKFVKREHRGATDDVNAMLNYGYGILYSHVWSAIALAGLEPFAGFLHVDRPGKPSLVLDFIEEFRQPIVDKVVLALVSKQFKVEWEAPDADAAREAHQATQSDKSTDYPQQRSLTRETRRALADRILERLEETEIYEKKRHKLSHIIQQQARRLAMFLRKERDYASFVMKW